MKLLNWLMLSVIVLLLPVILSGCVSAPISTPAPSAQGKVEGSFDFDSFVVNNLGVLTQVTRPPNCGTWVSFLRGVVKKESGWKKDAVYQEKFKDSSTGKLALSVGYFQLSIGDKNNYKTPYCQLLTVESLKDPRTNTGCALEIIERLLRDAEQRNQTPRQALGRYWSVIRDSKEVCGG